MSSTPSSRAVPSSATDPAARPEALAASVGSPASRSRTTRRVPLPVLAAAITVVMWASAFVAVRGVGTEFSPGALALGRQLAASAVLTVVVLVRATRTGVAIRHRLPRGRVLLGVGVWGAAWFGLYNVALNAAEQYLDAGTTALLVNVAPVLVAVMAGLLLGEGFPRRLLGGMAVAFAGVVLIAATTWTGAGNVLGVTLGLLAAATYAGSVVGQKRLLGRLDGLTMTWLGCLAGLLVTLPFAPVLAVEVVAAPVPVTLWLVYLGVFPTALAFLLWAYALARTSAGRLVSTTYAVPPLVVLIGWVALAETPAPPLALVGGVLCLAGVAVATLTRRPRPT